jgi:hypothetical protein
MFDLDILAAEIAAMVKASVASVAAPLLGRIAELEQRAAGPEDFAVRRMINDAIAALPMPRDGKSVTVTDVEPLVVAAVARAVSDLPPAKDGVSVTLDDVKPLIAAETERAVAALPLPDLVEPVETAVAAAVAALPPAIDGKSVTLDDVRPLIAQEAERAVAALSPVDVIAPVEAAVAAAVSALPAPVDGKSVTVADVEPIIAAAVERAVAALPTPADGRSVTVADVEPTIVAAVERAVAALPVAKDGVGLAGAMIDRTGALIVTLSDGKVCPLGRVDGRDGEPGLGFDDLSIEQTGERQATLKFVRGQQVKTFDLTVPAVIDRGVFKEGQAYTLGDAVTFGGSLWIAQKDTGDKPDGPDTGWRLAVKKGRDGRDLTRG